MSQSRARKAPGGSDANKNRATVVKVSGDNSLCSKPKEQNQRSRSKNKLPRSIRYDLDNALVGLCDVWFEDIKPHLVRNNIKLHVETHASGDHSKPSRPRSGGLDCSHLDPGVTAGQCELCRLLYNAANSIETAVSQAASASSSAGSAYAASSSLLASNSGRMMSLMSLGNNIGTRSKQRNLCHEHPVIISPPPVPRNWRVPCSCRNNRSQNDASTSKTARKPVKPPKDHEHPVIVSPPPVPKNWRVARPCRINSPQNSCSPRNDASTSKTARTPLKPPPKDHYIKHLRPSRKRVKSVDKSTQTFLPPVSPPTPSPSHVCYQNSVTQPGSKKNQLETKHSKLKISVTSRSPSKSKTTDPKNIVSRPNSPKVRKHRPSVPQKRSIPPQPRTERIAIADLDKRSNPSPPRSAALIRKPGTTQPSVSNKRTSIKATTSKTSTWSSKPRCNDTHTRPCSPQIQATAFYPPKVIINHKRKSRSRMGKETRQKTESALFDSDLISIIGENNDKRLRLLYKSPAASNDSFNSSILNLCPSYGRRQVSASCSRKVTPWR